MKDSKLSRWLYQNRCFLTSDDQKTITHLCLDGGRLHIPDDLMKDFFKEYSKGLKNGERYYICECTTNIVKFYCDLDFFCEEEINDNTIKEYSKKLQDIILHYFKEQYTMIVCKAPPKTVQKDKQKKVKTGIHIILPELFLTIEMAYSLSRVLANEMKEHYPEEDWNEIIDEQVYTNGLRMIGSRKVTNKKRKIKEQKKDEYEIIKIDEGRSYNPLFLYDNKGEVQTQKSLLYDLPVENIEHLLEACSIRSFDGEKALEPIEQIEESVMKKQKRKMSTKIDTDIDKKIIDRVESFIRYQTITQWNSPLRQLKKHNNFYIAKIDSMYCLNVQREHNSCGIYFQITSEGMYQRCFCRKETLEGRKNGYCSKFKSTVFPLPLEVRKMLFPRSKKKNTRPKQQNGTIRVESFGSNLLLKQENTLKDYLKMSLNTIKEIEHKCR